MEADLQLTVGSRSSITWLHLSTKKSLKKEKKTAEKEHYKHPATMTNVWIGARL